MRPQKPESKFTRENCALTSQEVPMFPFRPVSMAHIEMDDMERFQYEFVQQAGQPSNWLDDEHTQEK